VENRLSNHPGLLEAAVVVNQRIADMQNYLCAYVVVDKSGDFFDKEYSLTKHLRDYLSAVLPEYMIPSYFIPLDELPLNPNGKIDRKKLPPVDTSIGVGDGGFVVAQSDIEKKIAGIWKDVLGRDKVGVETNFFELGGNSIDLIKINTRIKEELNVDIPMVIMFRYATVRSLSDYLNSEEEKHDRIIDRDEEKQKAKSRLELMRNKKKRSS